MELHFLMYIFRNGELEFDIIFQVSGAAAAKNKKKIGGGSVIFRRRTPLSPSRPANKKIRTYVNGGGKNFYAAPPLHHYITDPSPLALQKLQVVRVRVMEETLRLRRAAVTVSIIVGTPAPHQCPHPTKPPSTSVAFFVMLFFVMLRFSNLVPYVAILKMFHVKIPVWPMSALGNKQSMHW